LINASDILPIRQQCELLGVSRSSFYYTPIPVDPLELQIMNDMDRIYLQYPFYGRPRLTFELQKLGYEIGEGKVGRMMKQMDIRAIYPRPNLSKPAPGHKIYPYLLRNTVITHPKHVYSTDITYIGMKNGFLYLCAVMDWYSRCVLSYRISNTLSSDFCVDAVEEAFQVYGKCEIFNTDQGSQFTSDAFTSLILNAGVKLSMDGRGRALDNVFIERLWRTVKYEHIFLNDYETGSQLRAGLDYYFEFYNRKRSHSSLGMRTPSDVMVLC
jgi:putative transposase